MRNFIHNSVLMKETLKGLNVRDNLTYVDTTFGFGGISKNILQKSQCKLIALDRDPDVVTKAGELLELYKSRFQFIFGKFGNLNEYLKKKNINFISGGIVADLGVSSMQLDNPERGFSFNQNAPLDMRMSKEGLSAKEVINTLSEEKLSKIFWEYGEEKNSRKIARNIIENRKNKTISTTFDLVKIINKSNKKNKYQKTHPATKVFQSLRIFINEELEELKKLISVAEKILMPGARLAIISFHSLEDRVVKISFNKMTGNISNLNRHLPSIEKGKVIKFKKINKRVTRPELHEIKKNPRSRSARLRVLERLEV